MSTKPIFSGGVLIEVEPKRYDELVRKEARLEILENAIRKYDYISEIKTMFSLEGEKDVHEN